jgi:1,4-alpha-glucan branching enzyme
VLNSDAEKYGGGNVGSLGGVAADHMSMHGRSYSLSINVPPFAAVVLRRRGD